MKPSAQNPTHSLAPGEVHVWLMPEPAAPPEAFAAVLAASERDEFARMAPAPARRFVCGRGLLRHTLSRYADPLPAAWVLQRTERGRPELLGMAGPSFNVSHTQGLVVCAVSAGTVGVDVERGRRLKDPKALAKRFFHPEEASQVLGAGGEDARRACFLRLWTLKEAHAKALGCGVAGQLGKLRFPARLPGGAREKEARDDFVEAPISLGDAESSAERGWVCWYRRPTAAHHLSVVAAGGTELSCHWLDTAGHDATAPLR
ncbi:MAG: 4'-phosphopantetheinyl transferase superfamily protein [Deltaproteobacteria bacterium]|nr:4'-phosphopantetheinyl transferase superfamily protein [Deltaproteobacteria bacterium]